MSRQGRRVPSRMGAGLLVLLVLSACTGPRVEGPRPERVRPVTEEHRAGASPAPFALTPLPDGRWRLVVQSPPDAPHSREFTLQEARSVLFVLHDGRMEPRARPAVFQLAPKTNGLGPSGWERRLWSDYAARYGASSLPPLGELADARLRLALRLAPGYMGEGVREAAEALLTDPLFVTGVIVSMTLYMAAWAMPEPLFSKATAATLTFVLMMSFTVAEIRNAAVVLLRLERDARKAHTLAELEAVAERFGRAAGATLLRILVMVAGWAVGKALPPVPRGGMGGRLMAPSGPRLPDDSLISSGQVVADGSLVMTGIASGTAASAARQESLCGDGSEDDGVPGHHIATIRNRASNVRGGPWTLVFEPLFKKAGMNLDAPENIVRVRGHKGPHPEEYHREIFNRLNLALLDCEGIDECRSALRAELKRLAEEICTPGSLLNRLLMKLDEP
jgi:hypothetical protein